ncbi:hypothetical protein GCM10010172_35190 [Paractinoplanes ferrugineus]|uniref:Uncharacterized protein n=1 Tax=Paractinoplanes ferrugineus TaxID=113564 RepID=A0A919MED9_9ACTN|nr:hypothetical protein [Actinoplanes ferrugineus]GIE16771.1 hypothetical protein Afe05nite_86110 [Actinoplanes ferrugineus]
MAALLAESLEALERVGCQVDFCDGPTLEPVDMRTCFVCELIAKLRVDQGLPARRADELTWAEAERQRDAAYMRRAVGR